MSIARVVIVAIVLWALPVSAGAPFEQCGASPTPTCRVALRGSFYYTQKPFPDDGRDRLVFNWLMGAATSIDEFADPTTTADYRMCVYANGALISEAIVPAGGDCNGSPCWKERPGRAYEYLDRAGIRGGATRIRLVADDDGMASVKLKGAGAALYDPILPFAPPVVVEVHNASNGICFGIGFSGADIFANSNVKGRFRARRK